MPVIIADWPDLPRLEDWYYDASSQTIEGRVFGVYRPCDGMYLSGIPVVLFDPVNFRVVSNYNTYTLGVPMGVDAMSSPAFEQEFSSPFLSRTS